jgi:hypothetical protein
LLLPFTQHVLNQRLKRLRSLREKGGADKEEEKEASKDSEAGEEPPAEEIGVAETRDERSDGG